MEPTIIPRDNPQVAVVAERALQRSDLPTALTVIKAIAKADGVLTGGDGYLTKYQMIRLCKAWLNHHYGNRNAPAPSVGEEK